MGKALRVPAAALGLVLALAGCLPRPLAPAASTDATGTASPSGTASPMPSATGTETPTASPSPSASPSPTDSPTPTPSQTPVVFRYVFPVQPAALAGFAPGGHPYPATDIFAPLGTDFVAVTDGVVDFVSTADRWDPEVGDLSVAGGLCVAIVGDDGVRYYGSHLSSVAEGIEPGVRVAAGQRLGAVGQSGNAAGTPPHLHFGISRPTFPEDWQRRRGEVDPIVFLQAWRQGIAVTPPLPQP